MFGQKCNCEWCKKNTTAVQATETRIEFLVEVFRLMFKEHFESVKPGISDTAKDIFRQSMIEYFGKKEIDHHALIEPIVNLSFSLVYGINKEFTPWIIASNCNDIHTGVENAFKALAVDIELPETPILSKILTPQIFVDLEVHEKELPKELADIYENHNKTNRVGLQDLISNLRSTLTGVDLDMSEKSPTIH